MTLENRGALVALKSLTVGRQGVTGYADDLPLKNSEEGPLLERFSSKGLRDDACFVVVNGKPITLWLKAPADADHARRVAEFLEANVEELEVFAAAPGIV